MRYRIASSSEWHPSDLYRLGVATLRMLVGLAVSILTFIFIGVAIRVFLRRLLCWLHTSLEPIQPSGSAHAGTHRPHRRNHANRRRRHFGHHPLCNGIRTALPLERLRLTCISSAPGFQPGWSLSPGRTNRGLCPIGWNERLGGCSAQVLAVGGLGFEIAIIAVAISAYF
jgi:hypothetical protein